MTPAALGANAAAAARATGGGAAAGPRIGADFNTFLTLLTTQLRNQDPTRAMDVQQMTQQLVQFAGVEQQLAMNRSLERLIALQQGGQLLAAGPLIGRRVEVEADRIALQNGQGALRLAPGPTGATEARIEVLDGAGRVLRATTLTIGSEPLTWQWDGREQGGRQLADGSYAVRVTGRDGQPLPFTVLGRATGAERTDGTVQLRLGRLAVPIERMRGLAEGS